MDIDIPLEDVEGSRVAIANKTPLVYVKRDSRVANLLQKADLEVVLLAPIENGLLEGVIPVAGNMTHGIIMLK